MFTPSMTDEELLAAAYQDYLEIHMKIKIALEKFVHNLKLRAGQRRCIHSVMETMTIRTKAKNTWNISFINDSYCPKIDGRFYNNYFIYHPLHRGDKVDFLFMYVLPDFELEKLSAHFLQRYKERYLDCNKVNLRGMHPALYFIYKNNDRIRTYYLPEDWTENDLKEKCFVISSQGLSVVKILGKMIVSITFLDQENLSRYKAQVYEEEALWNDFKKMADFNMDSEIWQPLFKKVFADPARTKQLFFNFFRRKTENNENIEEKLAKLDKDWDDFVGFQQEMSNCVDEIRKERLPKSLFDIGMTLEKKIKKGKD